LDRQEPLALACKEVLEALALREMTGVQGPLESKAQHLGCYQQQYMTMGFLTILVQQSLFKVDITIELATH
jgi:hypothetical protein